MSVQGDNSGNVPDFLKPEVFRLGVGVVDRNDPMWPCPISALSLQSAPDRIIVFVRLGESKIESQPDIAKWFTADVVDLAGERGIGMVDCDYSIVERYKTLTMTHWLPVPPDPE